MVIIDFLIGAKPLQCPWDKAASYLPQGI